MGISMNAKDAASRLNEIAEWLETESRGCITYTDIRAVNQTAKPNIAIALHKIIRSGLAGSNLSGIASAAATRNGRSVNWHGVRVAFGFEGADWLSEFDSDTAPPHMQIELPDCRQVKTDRTADELREWYRRQSLAWSGFLRTIAKRLDVTQKAGAPTAGGKASKTEEASGPGRPTNKDFWDDVFDGYWEQYEKTKISVPDYVAKNAYRICHSKGGNGGKPYKEKTIQDELNKRLKTKKAEQSSGLN